MMRHDPRRALPRGPLGLALAMLALAARAQALPDPGGPPPRPAGPPVQAASDPARDWRAVNEAVGAFPAGHADLVRWERARGWHTTPDHEDTREPAAAGWSLHDVARAALRANTVLGMTAEPNPIEAARRQQQAARIVLQAQRLWLQAIAARAEAALWRQGREAAALAAELAQRTQRAGAFSAERTLRESLPLQQAERDLRAAEQAERHAWVRLWQLVGGSDEPLQLRRHAPRELPPRPPLAQADGDLPPAWRERARRQHPDWAVLEAAAQRAQAALSAADRQRLQAAWDEAVARHAPQPPRPAAGAPRWPHAWEQALQAQGALLALQRQRDGDLLLAWQALRDAEAQATHWRQQALPAARELEEHTLLRYNGMLASPWDVLAAVRQRQQAERATLRAELAAWQAHLALQAVLAGLPYAESTSGPADEAASADVKGH